MAEAILKLAIEKLAGAAVQETLFLCGAESKLNSLQHELRWIQAFLKDAESKRHSDGKVKIWVSDVREVAYRIEDTIDKFIAEINNRNRPGKLNAVKRVLKNPIKLPAVHNLICEINDIQTRLREIKECTERYSINKELGSSDNDTLQNIPVILPDKDDPDVIGLQTDKENIVNLLLDPNIKELRVVSIVGQGGLGKTTLARKAYNSDKIKEEFKLRIWLSISQQFQVIDLLKTMLEKVRPLTEGEEKIVQKKDAVSQQRAKEYFITELNASLENNIRYLIIMDDVWANDVWSQVKEALPDVKNGSRVLITTRFSEIARRADPTCDPYDLHYLSEEQSQQLLLKKAFPGQDPKAYSEELLELLKLFAKECGFLPLALVVVGGLLSRQPPTYSSWQKTFKKFSWNVSDAGKECIKILETSYEDLPIHLKPCFMYFALFPEDYRIKAKSLIRMWVAEGFIPEEGGRTMEQTAEEYLEELVQRSLIQVSSRFYNESIKYCRTHDLLRDVAIQRAKENAFVEMISCQDGKRSSSSIRRISLHNYEYGSGLSPNLRSLFCFESPLPNLTELKLLKVLSHGENNKWPYYKGEIIDWQYCKGDIFKDLAQLRYLGLRSGISIGFEEDNWWEALFNVSHCISKFWKIINRMRNLQTLIIHLDYLKRVDLDVLDQIWDIKTLRHVIVTGMFFGPPSRAELTNLQTLKIARARREWVTEGWPTMPNIRVLKLSVFTNIYWESFRKFLSGPHHLTSLYLDTDDDFSWEQLGCEMTDMSVFPCYYSLLSFKVKGKWGRTASKVTESLFPIHLIKLTLENSHIKEDPMPILEKLKSLKLLRLYRAYDGRQLCCSAGGFPHLQCLILDDLQELEEWKAEEGAMPMLKKIKIYYCQKLRIIPKLHVTSLNKLSVKEVPSHLLRSLREEYGKFVQLDIQT